MEIPTKSSKLPNLSGEELHILRCGLVEDSFAVEMRWVRGIEGIAASRAVPGRSIYSLASLLPGQVTTDAADKVVLLGSSESPWGLAVPRLAQAQRIPRSALFPLPTSVFTPLSTPWDGVLRVGEDLVLLIAPGRLRPGGEDEAAPVRFVRMNPGPDSGEASRARNQMVLFATTEPRPGMRPLVFGLSMTQVVEVADAPRITPVPGSPTHVRGLTWWRNRPVAVLDLARRVGLPSSEPGARPRVLMTRTGPTEDVIGLLVRPGVRVLPLPVPHLPTNRPLPIDPTTVLLSAELKGETLVVPDLAAVLRAP